VADEDTGLGELWFQAASLGMGLFVGNPSPGMSTSCLPLRFARSMNLKGAVETTDFTDEHG